MDLGKVTSDGQSDASPVQSDKDSKNLTPSPETVPNIAQKRLSQEGGTPQASQSLGARQIREPTSDVEDKKTGILDRIKGKMDRIKVALGGTIKPWEKIDRCQKKAQACELKGDELSKKGKYQEATKHYAEAIKARKLEAVAFDELATYGEASTYPKLKKEALDKVAELELMLTPRGAEAGHNIKQANSKFQGDDPQMSASFYRSAATLFSAQAVISASEGKFQEAAALFRKTSDCYDKAAEKHQGVKDDASFRHNTRLSREALDKANELEMLGDDSTLTARYCVTAGELYSDQGQQFERLGKFKEAAKAYRQASDHYVKAVGNLPSDKRYDALVETCFDLSRKALEKAAAARKHL